MVYLLAGSNNKKFYYSDKSWCFDLHWYRYFYLLHKDEYFGKCLIANIRLYIYIPYAIALYDKCFNINVIEIFLRSISRVEYANLKRISKWKRKVYEGKGLSATNITLRPLKIPRSRVAGRVEKLSRFSRQNHSSSTRRE